MKMFWGLEVSIWGLKAQPAPCTGPHDLSETYVGKHSVMTNYNWVIKYSPLKVVLWITPV